MYQIHHCYDGTMRGQRNAFSDILNNAIFESEERLAVALEEFDYLTHHAYCSQWFVVIDALSGEILHEECTIEQYLSERCESI